MTVDANKSKVFNESDFIIIAWSYLGRKKTVNMKIQFERPYQGSNEIFVSHVDDVKEAAEL